MTPANSAQRAVPLWRFWVPLGLQLALILLAPAQALYTSVTGKTVVLQSAPVDPYDFFRGYYVTLRYDISSPETLKDVPGWEAIAPEQPENAPITPVNDTIYVVLQAPELAESEGMPQPWEPVQVSRDRPENLPSDQMALEGLYTGWQVLYDLERYYIPEDQRNEINQRIQEVQGDDPSAYVIEVKVDTRGQAIPVSLWIAGEQYQF